MRKFTAITASIFVAALTLGIGVWVGVAYHDSIGAALGHHEESGAAQSPRMNTSADGSNPDGKTLYWCKMDNYIQDHPGVCPICHMQLTPIKGQSAQIAAASAKRILYYWDPMLGPSSISKTPGKSAMGMDLVPVYSDEVSGGPQVTIDPAVVQNMGVQTAAATRGSLTKTLRTVGYLAAPETGLYDITLKVSGTIDKLDADQTGMRLHKGEALFDLYSPDLLVAEEELIAARKSVDAMGAAAGDVRAQAQELVAGAQRKLELLDVPDAEIDAIAKLDHAPKEITIRSPADGDLEDKMIVQGSYVQAGMKLMRIEDHRTLWLEAQVYEEQLPMVALGDVADATVDALPGKVFSGKIIFISPLLDNVNRTTSVRIALDNPDFVLKPGMYAAVRIHTRPLAETVLVPGAAVIDTGIRKIAFVREAMGHFSPRLVTTGMSGDDDQVQVLSGIAPGEIVVTSGQFLMDVESRTMEAIQKLQSSESAAPVQVPANTFSGAVKESDFDRQNH